MKTPNHAPKIGVSGAK